MVKKHLEAAFKTDTSGCFDLKVRRLPSSLVSVVVCGRNAQIKQYQRKLLQRRKHKDIHESSPAPFSHEGLAFFYFL